MEKQIEILEKKIEEIKNDPEAFAAEVIKNLEHSLKTLRETTKKESK